MPTIATHNGSDVHQAHNRRDPNVVTKEAHIDPNGHKEIWCHIDMKKAYDKLFGDSVAEYNANQKRDNRKIKSYFDNIKKDKQKHVAYEMIIGVYGANDIEKNKQIMKEFVQKWNKRNPNLKLIGAYYHNDEQGEAHVHIDYVPIAHYEKGLKKRNGLVRALGEMGFEKNGKATAQIQWEKRENQALEDICNAHGIKVEHPRNAKAHLEKEQFILTKENEELKKSIKKDRNIKEHIDVARFVRKNEPQLYESIAEGLKEYDLSEKENGIGRSRANISH